MSGNMTRIKNNQITVQTIDYTRLVPGTLVGTNFNANLTLNSNVTIIGNLAVSGNTSSINSINTYIQDPLVVFNSGYTGSISGYDIGFLVNRNYSSLGPYGSVNTAWVWVENDQAFEAIATSTSGNALTTLTSAGFANVKSGNTTMVSATVTNNLTAGSLTGTPISGGTGSFTYLTAVTGFSTSNAQITGGSISGISLASTISYAANFSSPNVVVSGGYITGLANLQATNISGTTGVVTNLSSGNILVTGGAVNGLTTLGATTGVVTNFSSGNILVTSGSATGLTNLQATNITGTNGVVTNFSSGNAYITGGYISGDTSISGTTGQFTNFSTGNALITAAGITTLQATNFSSGNARITGGYADNFAIGANTAATGAFTTLSTSGVTTHNGNVVAASGTASTSATTGALVVTGGVGVTGNVNIAGNLSVTGTLTYINTNTEIVNGIEIVAGNLVANSGTASTNTTTGALVVAGGAGVSGAIYAGSIQNTPIGSTTASTGAFTTLTTSSTATANGNLVAASGTASTSTTTGALVVVGGTGISGATYIGGITSITNTTTNTGASTGALQVAGGAYIAGNLFVGGNINATVTAITTQYADFTGNAAGVGAVTAGIASGYVPEPMAIINSFGNANQYVGVINGQNINNGPLASADIFLSPGNGTYVDTYLDMGIASGTYNYPGYSLINPNDAYLFVYGNSTTGGGNLLLGTGYNNDIVFTVDGINTNNEVMRITRSNVVAIKSTTAASSTTTGALTVAGGAGVAGQLYASGLNGTTGSVTTLQATNFSTGNAVISGGYITTSNITTTGTAVHNGNIVAASGTASTNTTTGALVVVGGAGISGNINAGQSAVFNTSNGAGMDFIVKGATNNTLIWARPNSTYDSVIIGNSATASTAVNGAKLLINSTDTILLPVGTNAQRPGSIGFSDTTGMFRYNSTIGAIEWYNGTSWASASTSFTVIVSNQFNGDGATTAFTLTQSATTAGVIVSINGVVQIPTTAYSVSGTTLTFTEAPATGDVIDVRILTTTSTVTGLSSATGKAQVNVDDSAGITFVSTSSAGTVFTIPIGGGMVSNDANVSIASANTPTTIDSFSTSAYRTAKYILQVTNGTNFQSEEVLVVQNGTSSTLTTYGVLTTNGNLGIMSTNVSGSTVSVQFTAANAGNTVRLWRQYLPL